MPATMTGNPARSIRRYTPPDGFDDLPFTYVFNGDDLVNGTNARNQFVYIEGGLGDFILRRVVGLDTVVNPVGGQFQIEDDFLRYIQADPVFVNGGGELPIVPELRYRELGAIRFDLYNVLVLDPPITPQFTFQNKINGAGGSGGVSDDFGIFVSPVLGPDGSSDPPNGVVNNTVLVGADLPRGIGAPGYADAIVQAGTPTGGWISQLDLIPGTGVAVNASMGAPGMNGNTAVIGFPTSAAPFVNGAAFACVRSSTGAWSIQQQLVPGDGAPQGSYGLSQAIFGNLAAVCSTEGGSGGIYIFKRVGTVWTEVQQFQPADIGPSDSMTVCAMTATQLFIGASTQNSSAGAVYVYTLNAAGLFVLTQKLLGAPADLFGISVGTDGNTLVIGAVNTGATPGKVYVYQPAAGGTWTLLQTLTSPDGVADDAFGNGVAVSGALIVIGARNAAIGAATTAGAAYIFIYNAGLFGFSQKLQAPTPTVQTYFGWSVGAWAGNTSWVIVGAPAVGNAAVEGTVYFFKTGFIDAFSVFKSQIAFQGVRRVRHLAPKEPTYKYKPKHFVYTLPVTIDVLGLTAGQPTAPITVYQNISDYDFDLYALMFSYAGALGPLSLESFYTKIWLYDAVKHQLSNLPVLDLFYNGAPGSKYQNGAIVPTLFYPQESQIRFDIFSLIANAAILPVTMTIHMIGRQRYPC